MRLGAAATASTAFHLAVIGKAGAAVHSDASRESHTSRISGTRERRGIDIVVVWEEMVMGSRHHQPSGQKRCFPWALISVSVSVINDRSGLNLDSIYC